MEINEKLESLKRDVEALKNERNKFEKGFYILLDHWEELPSEIKKETDRKLVSLGL